MFKLSGLVRSGALAAVFLAALLAQPSALRADSITVGGKTIHFDAPKGYVLADKRVYSEVTSRITNALPEGMTLHAFYVEDSVDRKFREGTTEYLDEYLMVASLGQVTRRNLSLAEFREFSDYLRNNQGGLFNEDVAAQARKAVEDATDGEIQLGNITSLGCFGITDTSISYLAIMRQEILAADGARLPLDQAVIMNTLLVDGKMLHVNQYRSITEADQAIQFKDRSAAIVGSMNFKQGPAGGGASASRRSSSVNSAEGTARSVGRSAGKFIVAVAAAGVIGFFVRKRKKKDGGRNDGKPGGPQS